MKSQFNALVKILVIFIIIAYLLLLTAGFVFNWLDKTNYFDLEKLKTLYKYLMTESTGQDQRGGRNNAFYTNAFLQIRNNEFQVN